MFKKKILLIAITFYIGSSSLVSCMDMQDELRKMGKENNDKKLNAGDPISGSVDGKKDEKLVVPKLELPKLENVLPNNQHIVNPVVNNVVDFNQRFDDFNQRPNGFNQQGFIMHPQLGQLPGDFPGGIQGANAALYFTRLGIVALSMGLVFVWCKIAQSANNKLNTYKFYNTKIDPVAKKISYAIGGVSLVSLGAMAFKVVFNV